MPDEQTPKPFDKIKLKDKTGVSRQYRIAIANPTIATVAALQETWIRFVESGLDALVIKGAEREKRIEAAVKMLERKAHDLETIKPAAWTDELWARSEAKFLRSVLAILTRDATADAPREGA